MAKRISIINRIFLITALILCCVPANAAQEHYTLNDFQKAVKNLFDDIDDYKFQKVLEKFKKEKAIPMLLEALNDNSKKVSLCAALILAEMKDDRVVPYFEEYLEGESLFGIVLVIQALDHLGREDLWQNGIDKLLYIMENPELDESKRVLAVTLLGFIGDKNTVPHIIDFINEQKEKKNERILFFPYKALGDIGDKEAAPFLIEELNRKDINKVNLDQVMYALGKIGDDQSISALVKYINNPNNSAFNCWNAAGALNLLPKEKKEPLLINLLNNKHASVRAEIILQLKNMNSSCKALNALKSIKNEKNERVRNILESTIRKLDQELGDSCNESVIKDGPIGNIGSLIDAFELYS